MSWRVRAHQPLVQLTTPQPQNGARTEVGARGGGGVMDGICRGWGSFLARYMSPCVPRTTCPDRLVGLVVKASASRAEGPGFESRLRRDFFGVESYQ